MVPRLNSSQGAGFLVFNMRYKELENYVTLKIRTTTYAQVHVLNGGVAFSKKESYMLLDPKERVKFKIEFPSATITPRHRELDSVQRSNRIIKYRYSPGRVARFWIEIAEDGGCKSVLEEQALYEGEYGRYQVQEPDIQA